MSRLPGAALLCALLCSLAPMAIAQSDSTIVAERVAQFDSSLSNEHPRLLLRPPDLPALREFAKGLAAEPGMESFAKRMLPPFDTQLPPQPPAVRNGTTAGAAAWREGYQVASDTGTMAQRHALAWLVTGEARHGREAARWLLHLASWKIDTQVYRTNDELFIQHLRPMIFAYDWAWHALTAEERQTIGSAIDERLAILAAQVQPKLSLTRATPPDNSLSHAMRFVSTLGQGGLALYHDARAAPGWLAWAYEYYARQFPVWGGDAGGWSEGLNYWATGTTQHLRFLEGMQLLGHDAPLRRPFFRNTVYFAVYGLMPYPGSSFGDLTNIMGPSPSIALMAEKFALLHEDPYPLAWAQRLKMSLPTSFGYYDFNAIDAFVHRFRLSQSKLPEADLAELPQSRLFDDVGIVTMHSRLGDAANDIMLGLRSSPQGSASHSFADQNSFVLNAFGEPLAINSGYREYYDSPHHKNWSRTTKAKNAVLFDGEGQLTKSAEATGRITRFAQGAHFTFATGDASKAYSAARPGDAKKALRHVFFVNRRFFVILDELQASAEMPFQWQLHARERMEIDAAQATVTQRKGNARLAVRFLLPEADGLAFSQTDAFSEPVVESFRTRMPNEWHVTAETKLRTSRREFLSILYPYRAGEEGTLPAVRRLATERGFALAWGQAQPEGAQFMLIAREAEQEVRTAGASMLGTAASLSREAGTTRVAGVQVKKLALDGLMSLEASRPLDVEMEESPEGMRFAVEAGAPVKLRLSALRGTRTVQGLAAGSWRTGNAADIGGDIELDLPSGVSRFILAPQGAIRR